jgi:hypothetical protein
MENNMKDIMKEVLEVVTPEELPLIKVFGSSILFEDSNDIDIAVYDSRLGRILNRRNTERKFHLITMSKEHWDNLRNLSSFKNLCFEWYNGKIIYGDDYTPSKTIIRNLVQNGPFRTPGFIRATEEKLKKRGFKNEED